MGRSGVILLPLAVVFGCRCSPSATPKDRTATDPQPSAAVGPRAPASPSVLSAASAAAPPHTSAGGDCLHSAPSLSVKLDGVQQSELGWRNVNDQEVGRLVVGAFTEAGGVNRRLRAAFGRFPEGSTPAAAAEAELIMMNPDLTCRGQELSGSLTVLQLTPAGPNADDVCALAELVCEDNETHHRVELRWAFHAAVARTALPGRP